MFVLDLLCLLRKLLKIIFITQNYSVNNNNVLMCFMPDKIVYLRIHF